MKRVLILGCNEITKRLLTDLCRHRSFVSDICLASRQKQDCDELKNLAASMGVRVVTSGIDMTNVEGAMMVGFFILIWLDEFESNVSMFCG